jgi:predicted component of viral defense system (DUF524 family)
VAKPEDIDKMHAYRDAIRIGPGRVPYITTAYVLYPGSSLQLYDEGRIGALPLRPGGSMEPLVTLLRRVLPIR